MTRLVVLLCALLLASCGGRAPESVPSGDAGADPSPDADLPEAAAESAADSELGPERYWCEAVCQAMDAAECHAEPDGYFQWCVDDCSRWYTVVGSDCAEELDAALKCLWSELVVICDDAGLPAVEPVPELAKCDWLVDRANACSFGGCWTEPDGDVFCQDGG